MTDRLKRTSLHAFHRANGARMVPFGGWDMPVQYSGILAEHRAVRTTAGLFDVSHMGEVAVRGPEAGLFLDHLVTNRIRSMAIGRVVYTPMCYEGGAVVDDLLVYRRGENDYFLCINAGNTPKDLEWITRQSTRFDCRARDVSTRYCQLALQGPAAEKIAAALTSKNLAEVKYYHFVEGKFAGYPSIISRTGYTGESGFEIYAPWEAGPEIARSVLDEGGGLGLVLAGLGARDSLRLEAGYPLYGHEISDSITPFEGGIGWTVKLKKEAGFVGKEALREQKMAGIPRRILYFTVDDRRIARPGTPVFVGDRAVGEVVSGTQSPILNKPIGSALIGTEYVSSSLLEVEVRGNRFPIRRVKPPLHLNGK